MVGGVPTFSQRSEFRRPLSIYSIYIRLCPLFKSKVELNFEAYMISSKLEFKKKYILEKRRFARKAYARLRMPDAMFHVASWHNTTL